MEHVFARPFASVREALTARPDWSLLPWRRPGSSLKHVSEGATWDPELSSKRYQEFERNCHRIQPLFRYDPVAKEDSDDHLTTASVLHKGPAGLFLWGKDEYKHTPVHPDSLVYVGSQWCLHTYGYHGLFKPDIDEVWQTIAPEYTETDYVLCVGPSTSEDMKATKAWFSPRMREDGTFNYDLDAKFGKSYQVSELRFFKQRGNCIPL